MNNNKFKYKMSSQSFATLIIAISAVLIYMLFKNFGVIVGFFGTFWRIFAPFIYGFVLAFFLNTPMRFFESKVFCTKVFKRIGNRTSRVLSVICAYLTVAALMTVFTLIVVPAITDSLSSLKESLPGIIDSVMLEVDSLIERFGIESAIAENSFSLSGKVMEIVEMAIGYLAKNAWSGIYSVVWGVISFLAGIFICFYILCAKEKLSEGSRKLLGLIFPANISSVIIGIASDIYKTLNQFINGQLIDSLVFGTVCYFVLLIAGMPYAMLVALISAITNMIPMIGPFIGAVPSALIILTESPVKMVIFVIITLVLQQIDGNIVAPRIVGSQIGLKPFWMLFAINVGTGLGGIAGIFIAIPFVAVMYSVVKNLTEARLAQKGLPTATTDEIYNVPGGVK